MGKGGGCTPSSMKKSGPTSDEKHDPAPPAGASAPSERAAPAAEAFPPAADATPAVPEKPAEIPAPPPELEVEKTVPEPLPEPEPVLEPEPAPAVDAVPEPEAPFEEAAEEPATEALTTTVFIVFYSMYGHIAKLAESIKEGVDSLEGAQGILFQVPETLPDSVLAKMGAPPKSAIPVISPKQLLEADAIIFGIPTRFGMMCAQMKAFFDATGSLWQSQALAGKPAGFFFSTGTQGGGQETTALTAISQLAHHGMIFVPIGYTSPALFDGEVHGSSPYGAGSFAGDGTRMPIDLELDVAAHQGRLTAIFASRLKRGMHLD